MIRKLLAVGLAFCLFNLQISFSGQSLTPSSSIPTKSWGSWVKVEFAKAEAATSTSTFKPQKIDTADYISLITMLVLAVAATALVATCEIGPNVEVYLFAASALTYILGEIAVNLSYKKISTKEIEYNENGDLTDKQYKSLVALRDSYKDVKGSAETKRTLQLAAGAGMLAAAGIAGGLYAKQKIQHALCVSALEKVTANPVDCTPAQLLECKAAAKVAFGEEIKIEIEKDVTMPSVPADAEVTTSAAKAWGAVQACEACQGSIGLNAVCGSKWAQDRLHGVACVVAENDSPSLFKSAPKNWLAQAFNVFIPSAKADDLIGMLGIGAVGIGIVVGLLIAKKTFIDNLISHPGKRALLFAAAGGIAMATSLSTSNIIKSCKSNISKIDQILNQYANYNNASSVNGGQINSQVTTKLSEGDDGIGSAFSFPNGQKVACLSKENKNGSCPSLNAMYEGTKTKDAKSGAVSSLGELKIDPGVASIASNMLQGADEVQGNSSLSSGALAKFAAAANQQNAARMALTKSRQGLNDFLKDNGQKTIDFEAQEKDLQKQLTQNTLIALQDQGKTTDDLVNAGLLLNPLMDAGKVSSETKAQVASLDLGKLKASPKAARPLATSAPEEPVKNTGNDAASNQTGEDEYDYAADAISNDGHSLWEVLTNRYHSSGYRHLFKKKN